MPPVTRYAKSGDVHLTDQVVGDAPLDLVFVHGWVSNVAYGWEIPPLARFLDRLASFSRLIIFDRRGTGMSDRVSDSALPTLEQRIEDIRTVLDTVGSERAAIFGVSEGGNMSLLFAATYPERTVALVTFGIFASESGVPTIPGRPPQSSGKRTSRASRASGREGYVRRARACRALCRRQTRHRCRARHPVALGPPHLESAKS
jgi:pimeloyl-ACP methyl ester carboxylesterase